MSVLDDFVGQCRALAHSPTAENEIAAATRDLITAPDAIKACAPSLNPTASSGGDEATIFEDDTLTVMVLATPPGIDQPPHDHEMSAIIGIYGGGEVHRFYRRVESEPAIVASGGKTIRAGETLTMGPTAIHAIAAEGDEVCYAVHTYLGRLSTVERSLFNPDTLLPEPMDLARYEQYCRPLAP